MVIEAIKGVYNPPWRLKTILEDIRWLAELFLEICWKLVFREANFLVDAITRVGFSISDFMCGKNLYLLKPIRLSFFIVPKPVALEASLFNAVFFYRKKKTRKKNIRSKIIPTQN